VIIFWSSLFLSGAVKKSSYATVRMWLQTNNFICREHTWHELLFLKLHAYYFFRKYELPSDPWTACSNDTAFWHHVQLSDAFFSAWTLGSDMMLGQWTLSHASDTRGHSLFVFGGRTVHISCRSLLTTLHISVCWLVIGVYIKLPRYSFVNHTRIRRRG
jgi:hypothetical protein